MGLRFGLGGMLLGLLASTAMAQATLDVPANLEQGQDAKLVYKDPTRAGGSIVIRITGGVQDGDPIEIEVQLDADGKGTHTWRVVGGWDTVFISAPDVTPVVRFVTQTSG